MAMEGNDTFKSIKQKLDSNEFEFKPDHWDKFEALMDGNPTSDKGILFKKSLYLKILGLAGLGITAISILVISLLNPDKNKKHNEKDDLVTTSHSIQADQNVQNGSETNVDQNEFIALKDQESTNAEISETSDLGEEMSNSGSVQFEEPISSQVSESGNEHQGSVSMNQDYEASESYKSNRIKGTNSAAVNRTAGDQATGTTQVENPETKFDATSLGDQIAATNDLVSSHLDKNTNVITKEVSNLSDNEVDQSATNNNAPTTTVQAGEELINSNSNQEDFTKPHDLLTSNTGTETNSTRSESSDQSINNSASQELEMSNEGDVGNRKVNNGAMSDLVDTNLGNDQITSQTVPRPDKNPIRKLLPRKFRFGPKPLVKLIVFVPTAMSQLFNPDKDSDEQNKDSNALFTSLTIGGGINYFNGYQNVGPTAPKATIDPVFTASYSRDISEKIGFVLGGSYFYKSGLNSVKSFETIDYTFGFEKQTTVITSDNLRFGGMLVGAYYKLMPNLKLNTSFGWNRLLDAKSAVTVTSESSLNGTTSSSTTEMGYVNGFSSNSFAAGIGFEYNIIDRIRLRTDYIVGLSDLTNDSYYLNSSKDRNSGLQVTLQYALINRKRYKK